MTSATLSAIWMPSAEDLAHLGPLWSIATTIVAILLAALIGGRNWRVCGILAIAGGLFTAWLCAKNFAHPITWAGLTPKGEWPMLVVDPFSNFFIFLISLFLVLITGMWWLGQGSDLTGLRTQRKDAVEFFVLFIGSAFGMALMVSTTNLLMIILAVESASLPSYGLAGFRKKHRPAAEASLKYILFGAVTSAIMIYGASLLYGSFHTLDLATIGAKIAVEGVSLLGGVALFAFLVGVGFKVSAVPFHFWAPDVFEGATIEVTTWLSVASKAAGIGLMLRIVSVLTSSLSSPEALRNISLAIAVLAALTCTVGNFSAFRQTNLKRLLAFSSIAHAGYMLMAAAILWIPSSVGDAEPVANPAFSAVIAYMVVYLLMNLGAFGCVALVYWTTGKETLDGFNGLGRRAPLVAVVMAICLFSLVGLPPFGGFIAKWYLLLALFDAKLIWLIFVAVFNTLISLYYYSRIAYAMYFTDDGQPALRTAPLGQFAVALCAAGILLTGTFAAGRLKNFSDARSRDAYAQTPTSRSIIAETP
jgi:NADH-quinone oxidoreductase subunit N